MGCERRDLRGVLLFQAVAHVARECTAHAAARSEDALGVISVWGLAQMIKDGFHVSNLNRI